MRSYFIFKYFFKTLILSTLLFSKFSYGSRLNAYEEIQPWRNSYLNKTVKVPHPLIIISHFEKMISSPSFKKIRRLALAPFLDGRNCHSGEGPPSIDFFRVHRILPENTPLHLTQAFMAGKKVSFMEKFVLKTLSLFEIGLKGGPSLYFIAKDLKNEKFIIQKRRVINEMFYHYFPSFPAEKARTILKAFKDLQLQTVLLEMETYREFFNEKCRFYSPSEDQKRNKKWPQTAFKVLSQFSKQQKQYVLKNMELKGKYIQLTVNKFSLAFLLLNSSSLSIKNISLLEIQ